MDRFINKRPRDSLNSPTTSSPNISENSNSTFELNPANIERDPGLRKQIDEFHINLRDRIRREYSSKGPSQPIGHNFPKTKYGQSMRSFREEWFNMFEWLEYSKSKDAAYCFCCYLFKPSKVNRFGDEVFTQKGFKNWKRALEKFGEHVGGVNSPHHNATLQLEAFKNQRQSVTHLFASQSREMEVDYHTRLRATLDVTTILLRQGLSFRGHDESSTSMNRGNFLEFLEWYSKRNEDLSKVVCQNAPGNNQMTCPQVQKQMANACAVETTLAILSDIGDNLFTILVDESRDISVKEQMAIVLRYVNKAGEVVERFLAVVHVRDTSSKCLKDAIDALFAKHGLSLSRLRGQGYDGASNMRGQFHGLKSLILKENPYAWYVHCFAHQLQLVIVSVAKTNRVVSDFFGLISLIVNMSGSSCKRADFLRQSEHDRIIQRLESGEITSGRGKNQETGLARPCETRWGSHYITLLRLHLMWPSVIQVLENVFDDGSNSDTRGMSKTLLMRMESYDFVFIFHLMKQILGYTNELSHLLQQRDQNIIQAMHLIENVKEQLQDFREKKWESFLKEVETFCVANNITIVNMEDIIKSRTRMKRDGQTVTNHHHYRVEVFCEVIDLVAQEIDNRFPEASTDLLLSVACLDPRYSYSNFNVDKLVHLAELYPEDFSWTERLMIRNQLEMYIYDVKKDKEFSLIEDLGSLAKKMIATRKAQTYPLVYRLIELALLLPVATASVERVFSAMNIVKTDLRNRMGDEWMNDCLVAYIEKEIFAKIDKEVILQRFQNMSSRRIQLPPTKR